MISARDEEFLYMFESIEIDILAIEAANGGHIW